ncbi:Spy/CpxP family protein refolding chaperone [Curvibacter sp. CHRR-16]|uniref:Spy/CpxP family protein refolding chaperone n=1 Tax=Curvibacter sp. CHRR-16 TaxID=2835872 RepID=UPI001BD9CC97|nr:Spy/CpxP family protein refolding chaperone [Curvibacter sp. CHRR-16]MBT0569919.1 Spy/CpxP family protein refolding chaperone [Curvibacter sp. CHRR-16]
MTNFSLRSHAKRTLIGAVTALVLVSGLTACGRPQHDFGANMTAEQYTAQRDKMVDKLGSKLDLNAEQKKLLAVVGDKMFEQRAALIGKTADPRAEMKALVAGDKFDATRAQTLINEKTAAIQAKSPEVIAAIANFYNSLNPAQQQKVRDYMDGHGHWFGRG